MNKYARKIQYRCVTAGVFMLVLISLSLLFALDAKAEEPKAKVDMDQKVEISVCLEDETRFMEVDLYRIGNFDGEEFTYLPEYLEIVEKDYSALDTDKEKESSISIIKDYLKDHEEIKPDASISVRDEGKSEELPLGLYLLVQNDNDHNAELRKIVYTEAPLYDEEQNIYLYDILLYPKWDRTIWFSFRPEVVYPLSIVILLGICTLLCLFSTRLVRTLGVTSVFVLSGLLGMKIGRIITNEFIWLMVFFVFFAFMVVGILWMIASIIGGAVKKSVGLDSLKKKMYWILPVISGIAGAFIIYNYVSQQWWFYILIPAIVVGVGEIIQYARKDKEVVFHTYEDLLELPILPKEESEVKGE